MSIVRHRLRFSPELVLVSEQILPREAARILPRKWWLKKFTNDSIGRGFNYLLATIILVFAYVAPKRTMVSWLNGTLWFVFSDFIVIERWFYGRGCHGIWDSMGLASPQQAAWPWEASFLGKSSFRTPYLARSMSVGGMVTCLFFAVAIPGFRYC